MQPTLVHPRTITPGRVAVVIALSLVLFLMVTVRGTGAPAGVRSSSSAAAIGDSSPVNPWAAGDAAVLEAFIDLGRNQVLAELVRSAEP